MGRSRKCDLEDVSARQAWPGELAVSSGPITSAVRPERGGVESRRAPDDGEARPRPAPVERLGDGFCRRTALRSQSRPRKPGRRSPSWRARIPAETLRLPGPGPEVRYEGDDAHLVRVPLPSPRIRTLRGPVGGCRSQGLQTNQSLPARPHFARRVRPRRRASCTRGRSPRDPRTRRRSRRRSARRRSRCATGSVPGLRTASTRYHRERSGRLPSVNRVRWKEPGRRINRRPARWSRRCLAVARSRPALPRRAQMYSQGDALGLERPAHVEGDARRARWVGGAVRGDERQPEHPPDRSRVRRVLGPSPEKREGITVRLRVPSARASP